VEVSHVGLDVHKDSIAVAYAQEERYLTQKGLSGHVVAPSLIPRHIRVLGTPAVVAGADGRAHPVEQPGLGRCGRAGPAHDALRVHRRQA
jgi:hypothetical protein